jgi:hypothetical protein
MQQFGWNRGKRTHLGHRRSNADGHKGASHRHRCRSNGLIRLRISTLAARSDKSHAQQHARDN